MLLHVYSGALGKYTTMTTPILPTKTLLLEYKLTPTELVADALVEQFFANHYAFLAALMAAWRSGSTSLNYTVGDDGAAAQLRIILEDYGYTVAGVDPEATDLVAVSWAA